MNAIVIEEEPIRFSISVCLFILLHAYAGTPDEVGYCYKLSESWFSSTFRSLLSGFVLVFSIFSQWLFHSQVCTCKCVVCLLGSMRRGGSVVEFFVCRRVGNHDGLLLRVCDWFDVGVLWIMILKTQIN